MGLSSAVEWWQEWQLRILVLSSLAVQFLLLFTAAWRKFAIPSWFRSIIWLSYLGSDALAIYALATLFNRQTKQDYSPAQGNSVLEVVWAPILLMHLGGQDPITAYNIEDNELWTRHIVTSLSQITVAIYVFCKSWRGGDTRLLQASILLFIPGVLKCLEKPLALKSASINSLASSFKLVDPTKEDKGNIQHDVKNIDTLDEYVQAARTSFQANENSEAHLSERKNRPPHIADPSSLFVDLASSYTDRLRVLNSIRALDEEKVYDLLQDGLSNIFDLVYTKEAISSFGKSLSARLVLHGWKSICGSWIRHLCMYLPWAAIGLFHKSHRETYNDNDVKVTYALFCCTAVLEVYSISMKMYVSAFTRSRSGTTTVTRSGTVSQYSLIGFFARNKRHTKKMWVVSKFQCKDFLDQRLCMNPCDSSFVITKLVLEYVKKGWTNQIQNADSYWKFNDRRGQGTLEYNKCDHALDWSLRRPFDESVLLWHIATDFCFYYMDASADHQCATARCNQDDDSGQGHGCAARCQRSLYHEKAVRCREMSNYMTYLLFVNPEMLMAGTRRSLFMTANAEVEEILENDELLKKILKAKKPGLKERLKGAEPRVQEIHKIKESTPSCDVVKAENKWLWEIERGLMQRVIDEVKLTKCTDVEDPTTKKSFIRDAWRISQALLALPDETKMWEVIQGVWVEMLCFSASRGRGYLHAKSLGTGGELLTHVWLLLSHMGMETLPERLQRPEHQVKEEMPAPLHSFQVSTAAGEGSV